MPRVLRRPMFRLGGNTDQGIMSGVAPRQGYASGELIRGAQERKKVLSEMIGRPSDRSLQDFMIDWGLGMASTPPAGNVLQTAASVARAPYEKFRESKKAEEGFQRQIGMAAAETEMSHQDKLAEIALKNMSSDERIMMEKRAQLLVDQGVVKTLAEGLRMELYKKTEDPAEARKTGIEEMAMRMALEDDDSGVKYEYFLPIAKTIQQAIEGEFDAEGATKEDRISNRLDRAQKYIVEDDIGERQGDDTYGITINNPEGTYKNDSVYYNPKDRQFYVYNGHTKTFHVVILPGQEDIKYAPTFE